MPEANDTVVEPTETTAPEVNGTEVDESTQAPVVQEEQDKVDRAEVERLQKELDKKNQELNLRRNREKELEAEKLKEAGQYKELYEKTQAELEAIQAEKERETIEQETNKFRKGILDSYPEEVREVAEATNLFWDDATDDNGEVSRELAEKQLRAKLDVLKAKLVREEENAGDNIQIHGNNPVQDAGDVPFESLSADEMRKRLPKADPR